MSKSKSKIAGRGPNRRFLALAHTLALYQRRKYELSRATRAPVYGNRLLFGALSVAATRRLENGIAPRPFCMGAFALDLGDPDP